MEAGNQHRIAILVACHDDGATIVESLGSVRTQPDAEIVIVDDGSTDPATLETLELLTNEGVNVLRQANAGPSVAWMTGLAATTAEYVMPFSSDDVLLEGSTQLLADALDANPGAGFAWGDIVTFGLARAYRPSVPALDPWLVTYTNCIPAYSLFRRSTLDEVGGWRPTDAPEDWDLWMRLAAHGVRGVYVQRPIYLYRRGEGGRFRRIGSRHEQVYAELRKVNAELFDRRAENRKRSSAPASLKRVIPLIDRLPGIPRLKKVQLAEVATLLFWSGGIRPTLRIALEGVRFRFSLIAPATKARD